MHIPDGYLDITASISTYALSIIYGLISYSRLKGSLDTDKVSLISILSATIFAAQMLNWPIPGGTSLHFVGGALAGIILGPYLGFMVISIVLIIQCLIFHDGGITALGANILNMAIIDVLVGYTLYRIIIKLFGKRGSTRFIASFIGGWLGISLAGLACGLEIGYSPLFPYGILITVPIMTVWHVILGVIEGLITALSISYIARKEPNLIYAEVM